MENQPECDDGSWDGGTKRSSVLKSIRHRSQHHLRAVCRVSQNTYQRVIQALVASTSLICLASGFIAAALLCVTATPANAASSAIATISLGDKTTTIGFQGVTRHDQVVVLTTNGQPGSFTYALAQHPAWITIDPATGNLTEIVGKAAAVRDWPFTVQVTDTKNASIHTFKTSLYVMQTATVATKIIGPAGGKVTDPFESVVLIVPSGFVSQNTKFSILRGTESDGEYAYTVTPAIQSSTPLQLYVPDPYLRQAELQQLTVQHQNPYAKSVSPSDRDTSGGWVRWASWNAQFLDVSSPLLGDHINRLANDVQAIPKHAANPFPAISSELWTLCGPQPQFAQSTTCADKDPVLFINGLALFGDLGGGSDEWAQFPEQLCNPILACIPTESTNRLAVFEFTWRTNARFRDVADDLANAISLIHQATGRSVHIVAHSFGGLLARTYIQNLAVSKGGANRAYLSDVASLTTLGTPHSGISPGDGQSFGTNLEFPNGQDLGLEFLCDQLSCNDAGKPTPEAYTYETQNGPASVCQYFDECGSPGLLVAQLATNLKLPVPTQVLIGLTDNTFTFYNGDWVISYRGQRLHPALSCPEPPNPNGPCADNAIDESLLTGYGNGVDVVEHVLGFPSDPKPSDPVPNGSSLGYRHIITAKLFGLTLPIPLTGAFGETGVGYNGANNCGDVNAHPACQAVLDWIEAHPAAPSQEKLISFNIKVLDANSGAPIAGAAVNMGALALASGAQKTDANGLATLTTVYYANTHYAAYAFAAGYLSESVVGYTTLDKPPPGAADFTPIQLQSLSLSPTKGSLGGTVTDATTGAHLAGVVYQLLKAESLFPVASGTTDSSGKYRVNQLVQGAYWLQLHKQGYWDGAFTFFAAPGKFTEADAVLNSPPGFGEF